jgi:hypothetical protein
MSDVRRSITRKRFHSGFGCTLGCLAADDPQPGLGQQFGAHVATDHRITDPGLATDFVGQLGTDLQDESCPPEVNSPAEPSHAGPNQIVAWHRAFVSQGPTEAINNLIKRIKRIGFCFRRSLPHQGLALRRAAQLGPTPERHSLLKR